MCHYAVVLQKIKFKHRNT